MEIQHKAIMELVPLVEQMKAIRDKYGLEIASVSVYGYSSTISVFDSYEGSESYKVTYAELADGRLTISGRRKIHDDI